MADVDAGFEPRRFSTRDVNGFSAAVPTNHFAPPGVILAVEGGPDGVPSLTSWPARLAELTATATAVITTTVKRMAAF